uniref:Glycine receptor subunit alpha-2-like n=1 Tax=Hirondellea gigas TaxID=1518452 RepID=A0A6A7G4D8_9CRUS
MSVAECVFQLLLLHVMLVSSMQTSSTVLRPERSVNYIDLRAVVFGDDVMVPTSGQIKQLLNETILRFSVSEFQGLTICTWMKKTRNDFYADLMFLTSGLREELFQTSIFFDYGTMWIRSDNYIGKLDFKFPFRTWVHFCLAISERNTLYVNGVVVDCNPSCNYNAFYENLMNNSLLIFGAGSIYEQVATHVQMADIRVYTQLLNSQEVAKVMRFEHLTDVDDVYSGKINRSILIKSILEKTETILILFSDDMTYRHARKTCRRYGGILPYSSEELVKQIDLTLDYEDIGQLWMNGNRTTSDECPSAYYIIDDKGNSVLLQELLICKARLQFICVVDRAVQFRILGNAFDEKSEFTAYLETITQHYMSFITKTRIYCIYNRHTYQFTIMNHDLVIWNSSYLFAQNYLMGRYLWTNNQINNQNEELLTFTNCRKDEFTCTNGDCIPILEVCNFGTQCKDKSDEYFCNYTRSRPSHYDKHFSKINFADSNVLNIGAKFKIIGIPEININTNRVTIEIGILISWKDSRMTFLNLNTAGPSSLSNEDIRFLWQPNIILSGVVAADKELLSLAKNPGNMSATAEQPGKRTIIGSYQALSYHGRHVQLVHQKDDVIRLSCNLDLFLYPFDVQICSLTMQLLGRQADVAWDTDKFDVLNSNITLILFTLLGVKQKFENYGTNTEVTINIGLQRLYGAYILTTYLPCVLLEVIGLSTFALPFSMMSDRLNVTVACLIVMAALFTQVSSTLPTAADSKMIDIWMFAHMFLFAFIFLSHVFLNRFRNPTLRTGHGVFNFPKDVRTGFCKGRYSRDSSGVNKAAVSPRPAAGDEKCIPKQTENPHKSWNSRLTPEVLNQVLGILTCSTYIVLCGVFFLVVYRERIAKLKQFMD